MVAAKQEREAAKHDREELLGYINMLFTSVQTQGKSIEGFRARLHALETGTNNIGAKVQALVQQVNNLSTTRGPPKTAWPRWRGGRQCWRRRSAGS